MNLRNLIIERLNRSGAYDWLRDVYYRVRLDNPQRRKFWSQFVTAGSLCFDVGANIGEMAGLYRSLEARVIAIEPQKSCADYLRAKFRKDDGVIIVEKAITAQKGTSEMYVCAANQLSTLSREWLTALQESQRFGDIPAFKKTLVQTTTLEEMVKEYGQPDLLKVDVEGGEYEVLKYLKAPVSLIAFEYAFPESLRSFELCLKHLDGLGPAVYNLSHDDKAFVFPAWVSSPQLFKWLNKELENNFCGNVFVKYSG